MGYVPQATAQMLRSGKTKTIVLAYVKQKADVTRQSNASVVLGLAEEMGELGYKVEVKRAPNKSGLLDGLRNVVQARAADVVVLWGLDDEIEEQAALLESLGQSFIVRGYHEDLHPNWVQVDWDHTGMIRRSVDKLAELGHERIAYLGHPAIYGYARRFLHGFHSIVAERFNRTVPENWILTSREDDDSSRQILEQVDQWFDLPEDQRPTAIACGQVLTPILSIEQMLLSHGIRIGDGPGELSMAGMMTRPSLTSGSAWWYSLSDTAMIQQMIHQQLIPIVRDGAPRRPIVRYLPELESVGHPPGKAGEEWEESI